jgi:hypothetical protein
MTKDLLIISGNSKSFEGPVLNNRVSTTQFGHYGNDLVIDEIRNDASAIFLNFFVNFRSAVVKQNSSSCGKSSLEALPSTHGWDRLKGILLELYLGWGHRSRFVFGCFGWQLTEEV